MKQFEIEIIDKEIQSKFETGVGFIEIVKPIEVWIKLPPNRDHKILFRERNERPIDETLKAIYYHLIEQFKCFLGIDSDQFSIDSNSFHDEPIKIGNRSFIKLLYYSKEEE